MSIADSGPARLLQALKQYAAQVRFDRRLECPPARTTTVHSALCGSRLTLDAAFADGRVGAIGYSVRACSLGQATTAILAQRAIGMDADGVRRVTAQLEAILDGQTVASDWPELALFAQITEAKLRHGSALLPFRALQHLFEAEAGEAGAQSM